MTMGTQLPTPPNEPSDLTSRTDTLPFYAEASSEITLRDRDPWTLRSRGSNAGSSVPSPPTDDPPDLDEYPSGSFFSYPLQMSTQRFDFPDPSNKASPTSNEADADIDLDRDDPDWVTSSDMLNVRVREVFPGDGDSPAWDAVSNQASPSYSDFSEDPFSDTNVQKLNDDDDMDTNNHDHEKTA